MGALDNHVKIIWVIVHVVFLTILADRFPDLVLQLRCNGVLAGVHMRNLRLLQSLGKGFPSFIRNIVCFANIQTPYITRRHLKNAEEVEYLFVSHSLVEILWRELKISQQNEHKNPGNSKHEFDSSLT